MQRKQIPDIFRATVKDDTLELVAGEELDDASWAAWFARYQAAFRQRNFPDDGQGEPFSGCRLDLRATVWADPSPLLSIALAIAEFVTDGGFVSILLPPDPSATDAVSERQASFLKFLAKEGFLDLLSLQNLENLSISRPQPSLSVEIKLGADPLTPDTLERLRLLSASLAFERATCLPARLLRVDVMDNGDPSQLERLDRWVERKLYDTIGPVVSDMVPSWAQAGIRYRMLMFLRETLHNIAEHAYIHRAASVGSTTGYAALYVRYREGALGEAPANWNRLEKAVSRETYSWRVPLMRPSTLRQPFPNTRTGFFEVFVMDAGQGLCRSLGDCPCADGSDPVHKCMRAVVEDGRGRRKTRPTRYGGLYLIRQLLEPARDYFRIRDENTWWGLELPLKTTSAGALGAGPITQSTESLGHARSTLEGLSWTARLSWLEKQDMGGHVGAWQGFHAPEDKPARDAVINVMRKTRRSVWPLSTPVVDLRFPQHRPIAPLVRPAGLVPELLLLPQPGWMKNRIQDEVASCLVDIALAANATLFVGDIPSEEALTYIAAIERSHKFCKQPFTMLGRVVLVTRELKTFVLSRVGGELLEHDPHESRDFLYNSDADDGDIVGMASYFAALRAHDSALAWELILSSGEAFTAQCVEWSNGLVLDGYLDFPQSIAHPVCRELYTLALRRLLSLFPRHGCRLQALDTLVESLLVRFDAAYHVSPARDHTEVEPLTLNIGSVQVSGLTAGSAAQDDGVTFFFFVHPSGCSTGRSLFAWHPEPKAVSGPCAQARVGRTPVVAPGGWKSFQMPRFAGKDSIYEEAPRECYRAWQEPSRTPMKLGHWCYGGHHDLLTLNLMLAFDTELDKINLEVAGSIARFVYGNFFRLFGLSRNDFDARGERLYNAIQQETYSHRLPDDLNIRSALLLYPSHPVTDHVIDRFLGMIQEPALSRIRKRILPILPIRRHRTGSGLQVSGLVLQRLATLAEPKPPVVFFDDALITGRTYAELKSLLRGLAIHDTYSLVLVDRLRFPSSHHVDGRKHLCFWRLDVPPMGSARDCPLCATLAATTQMATGLRNSADRARIFGWCETWRPLNPATQWSDGGLQPIPLRLGRPIRRFSIEPDPGAPGGYRQCGGKNREIEITNSAGLVSWISELHSITYRDDLCLEALCRDAIDPEARIQVLASQLLLYFPEFDAPIARDIGMELLKALWDAERHDRHSALAALALISCGAQWLHNILGTFLSPDRRRNLQTRNIDLVLLFVMADCSLGMLDLQKGGGDDLGNLKEVGVVRMAEVRAASKLQLYDQFHRLVMDARGKQHSSVLNQFANAGDDPRLLTKEFLEQARGNVAILKALVEEIKQSNIRAWAPTHQEFLQLKECVRFCADMLRDKLEQLTNLDEGNIEQHRAAFLCARELTRTCLEACRQLHFGVFAPIGLQEASRGRQLSEFSFMNELRAVTDAGPFRNDPSLFQWHPSTFYDVAIGSRNLKAADLAEAYVIWDEQLVDALRQLLTNARHATKVRHADGCHLADPWVRTPNPSGQRALMWGRLTLEQEYLSIELHNRASVSSIEVHEQTEKRPVSRTLRFYGILEYYDGNDGVLITKVAFPYAHALAAF